MNLGGRDRGGRPGGGGVVTRLVMRRRKKEREWKGREERNRIGVGRMVIGQGDIKGMRSRVRRVKREERIGVKEEEGGR